MNKNEYRRALIMLRPREKGYAGHVRLERRVMMGSLDFIVTAPQGETRLEAALAGQRGGEYFAAALGPLRRDRRGQAVLAWPFDPRQIDGRPLDAYSMVLVARVSGDGCEVVLAGNVDGARPLDMEKVRAAVCDLFREDGSPAADLPEPGEPEAVADTGPGLLTPEEAAAETRIFTRSRPGRTEHTRAGEGDDSAPAAPRETEAAEVEPAALMQPEGAARMWETGGDATDTGMEPANEGGGAAGAVLEMTEGSVTGMSETAMGATWMAKGEGGGTAGQAAEGTAAEALGVDPSQPWTGALAPLRAMFATQPPVETLEDDFVYVSAPLAGADPQASGWTADTCRVGLHVTEGRVDAVRYAVPALYTPEPPAGLEAYAWTGDNTHGYWVLTVDAQG